MTFAAYYSFNGLISNRLILINYLRIFPVSKISKDNKYILPI